MQWNNTQQKILAIVLMELFYIYFDVGGTYTSVRICQNWQNQSFNLKKRGIYSKLFVTLDLRFNVIF